MELEKTNNMNTLYEFYNVLLTNKQKGYLSLYYGDDYSLGEIAEEFEVSRQAVYDNIKRTEKVLMDYEQKLKLAQNYRLRNKKLDELANYAEEKYPDDRSLQRLIANLEELDDKDE